MKKWMISLFIFVCTQSAFAYRIFILDKLNLKSPIRIGYFSTDNPSSLRLLDQLKESFQSDSHIRIVNQTLPYGGDSELNGQLEKIRLMVEHNSPEADVFWEPRGPIGERDEITGILSSKGKLYW